MTVARVGGYSVRRRVVERTYFGWSGLLTSYKASIKAFSFWALSAMWRSMVVSTGGWPKLVQFTGTEPHWCFTCTSSQRDVKGVARPLPNTVKIQSTESKW